MNIVEIGVKVKEHSVKITECQSGQKNKFILYVKHYKMGKSTKDALTLAGIPVTDNAIYNVSHIVQGKRWKYISSQYNIQQKWKITDKSDFVIPVCELLEKGYSPSEIYELLPDILGKRDNVLPFIRGIKRRKYYTNISKNYNW
jgi:hypothetical protein